jgi:hypothetical protein
MDIIRTQRKGKHLYTLVKYHIHKISKDNLPMNDKHRHKQPNIQSTTGNEHQLAAHTLYILGINTAISTETPKSNGHDGQPPNNKLPILKTFGIATHRTKDKSTTV